MDAYEERRALLLVDGLDEAGSVKPDLVQWLARSGYPSAPRLCRAREIGGNGTPTTGVASPRYVLITSRPHGINEHISVPGEDHGEPPFPTPVLQRSSM